MSEWLTIADVARELQVSESVLRADRRLKKHRFGARTIRVSRADLEAYKAACLDVEQEPIRRRKRTELVDPKRTKELLGI